MKNLSPIASVFSTSLLAVSIMLLAGCQPKPDSLSTEISQKAHQEEGHHHEESRIVLNDKEMQEFGIELAVVKTQALPMEIELPGEVMINPDRLAHVVPVVSGLVQSVHKTLGDTVQRGDVMAVLESRELADAKADYLAAQERFNLAQSNYNREKELYGERISSKLEFLETQQQLAESNIRLRAAKQKLLALKVTESQLTQLSSNPNGNYARFSIYAPISGTVIEKHITLGEYLHGEAKAFAIADLSSVWINLSVYHENLPYVRQGQKVLITEGYGPEDVHTGVISYVEPQVGEETRTALARVVMKNKEHHWRPGMFVKGKITLDTPTQESRLAVPKTALQMLENQPVVFLKTHQGFEPRPVKIGRETETFVEIKSGLNPGQKYVEKGGFILKSQLAKESFGDGDGHGH